MNESVLEWWRERVRFREYVMTLHAEEEMSADGFTIVDLERAILTGEIHEHQRDRQTGERKYLIRGCCSAGTPVELVAKRSPTGKLVIITVYEP